MQELLSLGNLYVSDFLKSDENPRTEKHELKLVLDSDGAARLEKMAPKETMWGERYWYRSGTNETMKMALKDVVDSITSIFKLNQDDLWIDIASNDLTLLGFVPKNLIRVGIDPVSDPTFLINKNSNTNLVIQDYFNAKIFKESKYGNKKAKIITCISCFYDIEDNNSFLKDICDVLDDNGLFVLQFSYTPLMIKQMAYDNLCFKPDCYLTGINKKIQDINIGDFVLDKNGEYTEVVNKFERKYNGEMFKIKASYLEEIICTPEHPILVVKNNSQNNKTEWVEAKDIQLNDYLVIPKIKTKEINKLIDLSIYNKYNDPHYRRGLKELELTDDILWMMGLYVAEGHISGKPTNLQINFTLHQKEMSFASKIQDVFNKIGYKATIRLSKINKSMNVQVSCTALARVFEVWFGKYARNKKIPDFIFSATKDVTIPFLNGLIDGDGNIDTNGQVGLHSSSKYLIYQVQLMLATLNAMTGFSYVKPYPNRIINNCVLKSNDSWQIRGKNKYLDNIFNTNYSKIRPNIQYKFDENYIYIPVKKISIEKYDGLVYNIETKNNTYVVSNAVVHNCHEHCYYYSLFNLKKLFERNNFTMMDCILNDVNAGSARIYLMKNDSNKKYFSTQPFRDVAQFRIESLLEYEKTLKLDSVDTWQKFLQDINSLRDKLITFIKQEKSKGKIIYGYGASTKFNTTLQYFGLDHTLITKIADRSPAKWGLRTVGSNIPICSEEEMRRDSPDYLLLGPWFFINEFMDREKEYLENGGKFIISAPKFEIIGM